MAEKRKARLVEKHKQQQDRAAAAAEGLKKQAEALEKKDAKRDAVADAIIASVADARESGAAFKAFTDDISRNLSNLINRPVSGAPIPHRNELRDMIKEALRDVLPQVVPLQQAGHQQVHLCLRCQKPREDPLDVLCRCGRHW